MKKLSILAVMAVAAWGLSSCDEYTLPNPPAQSNEQEPLFETSNLKLSMPQSNVVDLSAIKQTDRVLLMNANPCVLPEGYSLKVVGHVMNGSENAEFPCITVTPDEPDGTATVWAVAADLEEAYISMYGHNPKNMPSLTIHFVPYIVKGSTEYRVLDATNYVEGVFNFTPFGPGHVIESAYYMVTSANNWDVAKAIPMIQTTPGDPYDNSEFTATFSVSKAEATAGFQYKVIPASVFTSGTLSNGYGSDPADAMSGELVEANGKDMAGAVAYPGDYKLTVNMLPLTFSMGYNFSTLYVPGNGSSTTVVSKMQQLPTDNGSYFRGVAVLASKFWLSGTPDDLHTGFYNDQTTTSGEDYSGTLAYGEVTTSNSMVVGARKGLYMVIANLGDAKWNATQIKNIGAVGDFQGWNPETAPLFTPSSDYLKWTIRNLELNGNDFKFCGNKGWGINFGGTPDHLVVDGGNINNYGGAGKYDITLDFSTLPYTATFTKK